MTILSTLKKTYIALSEPQLLTCKAKYLLILSHMRSRSSVLSHILGSHSCISGYRELHQPYISYRDFMNLRLSLYQEWKRTPKTIYFLDKLLHERYVLSNEMMAQPSLKLLFLIREPSRTIKSIVDMGYRGKLFSLRDPENALSYYCSRMAGLMRCANNYENEFFFIDSDNLIDNPELVLENLSQWLELDIPLSKNYAIFGGTGKYGAGDTSIHIHSGVIKDTPNHQVIDLPPQLLEQANYFYEKCKLTLTNNCLSKTA